MAPRRVRDDEEDRTIVSIEMVAENLATQVAELQVFIQQLKNSRQGSLDPIKEAT